MSLLNYTTKMSAEKTIGEIQAMLVKNGAMSVLSQYDNNGYIVSLSFRLKVDDRILDIELPSDWRPVLTILERDSKVPQRLCTQEQALKVSWRIIKDWVETQMAILQTKMVTVDQIFLPYIMNSKGQSFYQYYLENPKILMLE